MGEEGLQAKPRRRFGRTTNSKHKHPIHPHHLERRFAVPEVEGVDRVWVGDITYVPTREGWLYLAVVLELASRRVVGWAMKDTLEARLATDALTMALWSRKPGHRLLGQCGGGELLRHAGMGADRTERLAHPSRSPAWDLRLH
ncbi:hypothetical protein BH23GEM3_BH23GEM3_12460 [soil metagenome]